MRGVYEEAGKKTATAILKQGFVTEEEFNRLVGTVIKTKQEQDAAVDHLLNNANVFALHEDATVTLQSRAVESFLRDELKIEQ